MANVSKYHIRLQNVDAVGNQIILYLETTASDTLVDVSSNEELPVGVLNLQDIVDNLNELAFKGNDNDILHFVLDEDYTETLPENFYKNLSDIDDSSISATKGWSSSKINGLLEDKERLVAMIENCTVSQKNRIKSALGLV